jgi:hypothetical protein
MTSENEGIPLHKGMCTVREGSSTKIALRDDFDRIYDERLASERSKMHASAFQFVHELKASSEVHPLTLSLDELANSTLKCIQKNEKESIQAMIIELRKTAVDAWRRSRGKSVDEVSTIKNTFVEPSILKIAVVGCYVIKYHVDTILSEVLNSLAAIYQLANNSELGVQGTGQHLDATVPSKAVMKALYIIGASTIPNRLFELTKTILHQKVEITWGYLSNEKLISDPLASTKGNFFKEAMDTIASNESLFDFFDKDRDLMVNCLCRFALLASLTIFAETSEIRSTYFAEYGGTRIRAMVMDMSDDPAQYSVLFSDPADIIKAYLKKLNNIIDPITLIGWST